jgi:hypothetical protein
MKRPYLLTLKIHFQSVQKEFFLDSSKTFDIQKKSSFCKLKNGSKDYINEKQNKKSSFQSLERRHQ